MSRSEVLAKATRVLGSRAAAKSWMQQPAIGLNRMRPVELLSTPTGTRLVDVYLDQIEHGVYV